MSFVKAEDTWPQICLSLVHRDSATCMNVCAMRLQQGCTHAGDGCMVWCLHAGLMLHACCCVASSGGIVTPQCTVPAASRQPCQDCMPLHRSGAISAWLSALTLPGASGAAWTCANMARMPSIVGKAEP